MTFFICFIPCRGKKQTIVICKSHSCKCTACDSEKKTSQLADISDPVVDCFTFEWNVCRIQSKLTAENTEIKPGLSKILFILLMRDLKGICHKKEMFQNNENTWRQSKVSFKAAEWRRREAPRSAWWRRRAQSGPLFSTALPPPKGMPLWENTRDGHLSPAGGGRETPAVRGRVDKALWSVSVILLLFLTLPKCSDEVSAPEWLDSWRQYITGLGSCCCDLTTGWFSGWGRPFWVDITVVRSLSHLSQHLRL